MSFIAPEPLPILRNPITLRLEEVGGVDRGHHFQGQVLFVIGDAVADVGQVSFRCQVLHL
jgi:hypothetical protein